MRISRENLNSDKDIAMKISKTLLCTCFMMFTSASYADPADVLKFDDAVWMGFDAVGSTLYFHEFSRVETNSKTGNVKYSSHGYLDASAVLPEKCMKFYTGHMGYICAADAPYFQYVVNSKGRASIKCQNSPFKD